MKTPPERDGWRRVRRIFGDAAELPPGDRDAFLSRACHGDPDLQARVEALLAADSEAADFLNAPVEEYAAELVAELEDQGPAPAERFEDHLLGPYRIVGQIGRGGMGEVYEAYDTRLDRRVAIKLLPREWSQEPEARERFRREARAASTLDHPNICTVYDLGETEDAQAEPRLFIVLAHYQGETLAERIARGPLPILEAREIAIQIARGLERAHAAGVVHRDIKPANVMVTGGDGTEADRVASDRVASDRVKILDFGIAKIAGDAGLTRTNTSPGTPAYMSPEQVRGDPADHRSDIWSLGVVLYEMLAGQRPFRGDSAQASIYATLHHDPAPLRSIRSQVPAVLERVVAKAMAKDPAARYRRATDLLADLEAGTAPAPRLAGRRRGRWLAAASGAAALLALAAGWTLRDSKGQRTGTPVVAEPLPVVAVLPFVNRTGDADLDWYGEGIARLVMDNLSQSRHLHVVSAQRGAVLAVSGEPNELTQRAVTRGIGMLLTGEILPGADGLSVAARLEDSGDGRQLAANRVDGLTAKDLLQAADKVSRAARKGLEVPPAEAVDVFAADFAASNPDAYASYLEGLRAYTEYRWQEAAVAFAAALAQAPDFTMARTRLAYTRAMAGRTEEALELVRIALADANRLPDRDARYVRAASAHIARDYDEAIEIYRGIIERYPFETEAHYVLAQLLFSKRRYQEELGILAALTRLEPENHVIWSMSGRAHLALGNLHQAVSALQRYVELEPQSANGRHLLGDAYRAQEEFDLAVGKYTQALEIDPGFHFSTVALATTEVLQGQRISARNRLTALATDPKATARYRIDAGLDLASFYRSEGRFRQAATTLEQLKVPIAQEKVREALALSVQGLSWMEVGEIRRATRDIATAVERSPGVPTRYLFARGLLELAEQRLDAVNETAIQILEQAPPPEDPDRTADKAASYLRGLLWLAKDDAERALAEFARATDLEGYEYAIYRLGLARAYLAAGRLPEARAAAREASRSPEPREPRLDLELDRVRARLLLAQIEEAAGRPETAAPHAREFLERWAAADSGLDELATARRLAALGK